MPDICKECTVSDCRLKKYIEGGELDLSGLLTAWRTLHEICPNSELLRKSYQEEIGKLIASRPSPPADADLS